METKTNFKNYIYAALFAAIIFVCTAFIKIPMPGVGGYVHLGDTFIYLAASFLPFPFALYAAAIGAAFADVSLGYITTWAPFTFVIKALMAFCFTSKAKTLLNKRNGIALFFAALINVGGYYIAEVVLYGNVYSPIASVPFNLIQSVGGSVFFVICAVALDKIKIKSYLQ
jgi:Predicted membrane protein